MCTRAEDKGVVFMGPILKCFFENPQLSWDECSLVFMMTLLCRNTILFLLILTAFEDS